jgi:hypothetical protein
MSPSAPRNDNVILRVIASEAKESRDNLGERLYTLPPPPATLSRWERVGVRVRMGQFVVVEDRCHEAVVPAPLVPVELDCLAYTGSRKYPRIPHQCHFGRSPSVISSAARNLGQKTKISQSQPLTFVRGRHLRNDNGLDAIPRKEVFADASPHPRRRRALLRVTHAPRRCCHGASNAALHVLFAVRRKT